MEGFRRSKAMFAAVSLGVFDLLAEGPLDSASVAERLRTNPRATQRLLEACAGLNLLENRDGQFVNAPLGDIYLRRSSERALTGYILYSNDALYRLWEHLDDAIREGTPRWEQTFGRPAPIFEHFFSTPETMHTFLMAMHGLGVASSPEVVRAFDLSRFRMIATSAQPPDILRSPPARRGPNCAARCSTWRKSFRWPKNRSENPA